MKVSRDFDLYEFVDPVTWQFRGEKSIELIDSRIISLSQFFRDFFKVPVTINNWHEDGQYKESGLRNFLSKTGASFSQHKFGRAADLKFQGLSPEFIREQVRINWPAFKVAGLTTIEKNTPTWVHIDVRFTGLQMLYEVPFQ